ncbi:MAG: glycerophosphoryl diester phosphodiesterase membrane domain-containing protein [Acidobacteriota bacterium]|nr:glycerophosphoryl diester phosphodiesterase membrane domain-containing protein [Acidobacteriota bacterium]
MATMDLRPMTLGEVLDRTFTLYKENFWLFAGIVAIPYLIIVVFSALYSGLLLAPTITPGETVSPVMAVQLFGEILTTLVLFGLVGLLVFASAQAATVVAVSDLYLGRKPGLAQSFVRVRGRILHVLLVMILIYLMCGFGMIFFIFPGIYLLCRTALAVPAATLEETGAGGALSRSFQLTKGNAAQIFAVYVLLIFLVFLSIFIFQFPFLVAAGSLAKPHALSLGMQILEGVASWVSGVIVWPIGTIAFSLIYYNQRVRKEAFDLEKLMASLEPGEAPPSPSAA